MAMNIDTHGDFNMYGNYIIDEGDYLFTLQNIINKHFRVERCGSIRWTGNPYDADINVQAIYEAENIRFSDLAYGTSSIGAAISKGSAAHKAASCRSTP